MKIDFFHSPFVTESHGCLSKKINIFIPLSLFTQALKHSSSSLSPNPHLLSPLP